MTVYINGKPVIRKDDKIFVSTQDPCYKNISGHPVIIMYTNVAKACDAKNVSHDVFENGMPLCHKKSYFGKSTGDEAGDLKGVVSKTIQGKAEFLSASSNVFIDGIPAVRHGDKMISNNRNTEVGFVVRT